MRWRSASGAVGISYVAEEQDLADSLFAGTEVVLERIACSPRDSKVAVGFLKFVHYHHHPGSGVDHCL